MMLALNSDIFMVSPNQRAAVETNNNVSNCSGGSDDVNASRGLIGVKEGVNITLIPRKFKDRENGPRTVHVCMAVFIQVLNIIYRHGVLINMACLCGCHRCTVYLTTDMNFNRSYRSPGRLTLVSVTSLTLLPKGPGASCLTIRHRLLPRHPCHWLLLDLLTQHPVVPPLS